MSNPIQLHLGCGKRNFGDPWIHIDGGDHPHLVGHDITKLDYSDNSVDLIYSSHVIEYFDRDEVVPVLKEWYRVLRPSGRLRLAVPNFTMLACMYCDGEINLSQVLGPLYGKMPMGDSTIYHKTTYDRASLTALLESVGFHSVYEYDWKTTTHADYDDHSQAFIPHMDKKNGKLISLNLEARK